jgi:hypothetical protein
MAENKSVGQKLLLVTKTLKDYEGKFSEYDAKLKELENKLLDSARVHVSDAPPKEQRQQPLAISPESDKQVISTKEKDRPYASASKAPILDGRSKPAASRTSPPPTAVQPAPVNKSIPIDVGYDKGILWSYNAADDEWIRSSVVFKMDKTPFAEGALRSAHKLEIKSVTGPADTPPEPAIVGDKLIKASLPLGLTSFGDKYVSKISIKPVPAERYFEDVKMQAMCAELGNKFNQRGMPKPIQFLPAWVLEFNKSGTIYCGLEPYIEGEFTKMNSNYGAVLSDRNTPQAFSHFTWEQSNHSLLVVDLQGVKDFYTDPQIHTKDGKGFGLGNLGMNGVDRFLKSHKCNAICQMLALPLLNIPDSLKKRTALMKGTMKVPYIEDQLGTEPPQKWEGPADLTRGEFQCVQTLSGHDDRVVSLCVAGKFLWSGTYDGTIKAWNLSTYALETTINAHRKSVESMCANNINLFSASADHSIKVWDLSTFESVAQLRDHIGEVNCVCLTDKTLGYLISASFDKNIKVWNARTYKCVQNLEGHSKAIKALAVSGSILFSGSNDGSIMIWNLKYMSCLFTIDAHDGWVKDLVVKDKVLYSGAFDHLIKEWDIISFNPGAVLAEHNDHLLALLATDKFLFSASQDRSILVWDYVTKKPVATLKGHRSGVQAIATDGKHIFSGSDDYTVKVWKWSR